MRCKVSIGIISGALKSDPFLRQSKFRRLYNSAVFKQLPTHGKIDGLWIVLAFKSSDSFNGSCQ